MSNFGKPATITLQDGRTISGIYCQGCPGSWYYGEESSPNYLMLPDNSRFDLSDDQVLSLHFAPTTISEQGTIP